MTTQIAILAIVCPFAAPAAVTVQTEQIGTERADWNAPAWDFKTLHKPSYALYGSAAASPDPRQLDDADWVKIAAVGTRPKAAGAKWGGRWGVNLRHDSGALLGKFRWLVWQVKPTLAMPSPGQVPKRGTTSPEWSNTWYVELDVHTPESVNQAGDFIPAGAQLKEVIVRSHQRQSICGKCSVST